MRIRGYVRLSDLRFAADLTPEEREEAETGLDRQAEDIRQYARTGGHTVERIVEEAGSAFSSRVRPHFEEELEALSRQTAPLRRARGAAIDVFVVRSSAQSLSNATTA